MNMDEKMQTEFVVRCEHVQKSFPRKKGGDLKVIEDFNIEIEKNEFVVLFGPGQCGKSTLINLVAGLETVSSGHIYVNDQLVKQPGPERGVVYQETWLFPWLTVMGNVNAVAVAVLTDCACIVLTENSALDDDAKMRAEQQGVTILRSDKNAYELAVLISKLI